MWIFVWPIHFGRCSSPISLGRQSAASDASPCAFGRTVAGPPSAHGFREADRVNKTKHGDHANKISRKYGRKIDKTSLKSQWSSGQSSRGVEQRGAAREERQGKGEPGLNQIDDLTHLKAHVHRHPRRQRPAPVGCPFWCRNSSRAIPTKR